MRKAKLAIPVMTAIGETIATIATVAISAIVLQIMQSQKDSKELNLLKNPAFLPSKQGTLKLLVAFALRNVATGVERAFWNIFGFAQLFPELDRLNPAQDAARQST
jgi:hypothetical protein